MSCSVRVPSVCKSSPSCVSTRLGATRLGAAGDRRLDIFAADMISLALSGLNLWGFTEQGNPARIPAARGSALARQLREHRDIRSLQKILARADAPIEALARQARAGAEQQSQDHRQGAIEKQSRPRLSDRRERMVQKRDVGVVEVALEMGLAAASQRRVVRGLGVLRIALQDRVVILVVLQTEDAAALLFQGALQIRGALARDARLLHDRCVGLLDLARNLVAQRVAFGERAEILRVIAIIALRGVRQPGLGAGELALQVLQQRIVE